MTTPGQERILDTALHLFGTQGYASTSIATIARAAGVAQGLLYRYYPGKDALLRELIARGMAQVQASLQPLLAGAGPESLVAYTTGLAATLRSHQQFWRLITATRMQPEVGAAFAADLAQGQALILELLGRALAAGGHPDPATGARLFFAAVDGVAIHYLTEPDTYPLEAVLAQLAQDFGAGVQGNGTDT